MARICFVVTSMGSGGAERNVAILSNNLVNMGHDVHIVLLFNGNVFYELDKRVKTHELFSKRKSKLGKILFWKKELKRLFIRLDIDTVIGIGIKYGTICSFALSNDKSIKLIVRGTSTYQLSFAEKIGIFFFGKRINNFVCQTKAQKLCLPKKIRQKSIVISNPFSTYDQNKNTLGFESKRFICIGRLDDNSKRQSIILKAFALFKKTDEDGFMLHFYGSDNDGGKTTDFLIKMASDLRINKDVVFNPATKEIHSVIKNSFAFLCASKNEGMPNALIESLMLGIPCISSNWAGSEEIIIDGLNGYIFGDSSDYIKLANQMIAISKITKDDYIKLSNNSYKTNSEIYNINNVIDLWNGLINNRI